MGQHVYTLSKETINKMKQHYKNALTNEPVGATFRAKTTNAVITAYNSGKVLFQGAKPEVEAGKWVDVKREGNTKKPKKVAQATTGYTPPTTIFKQTHIGSDESGTGDYFGPVTVASAYVEEDQIEALKRLGIQDSKKIDDQTVLRLAKEIVKLKVPYSLLILHNEKYNFHQQNGWSQGKIKAMLHHHVNNLLLKKIADKPYKGIVIDQFCEPSLYERYIATENEQLAPKTYFITKAESHSIAVATSSVIARASFLKELERLSALVGFTLLKGASKQVDQRIAQIMKQDRQLLNQCAKLHFVNTKKAEAYL